MSYQVIARKWRPQTFEEVTGQEAITRTLRNAVEHERLHHAYIFSGARGVGKTTTARLLAKALNCHKSVKPTVFPCSINDATACASCREIAEGRSIDVLEIDAASNTGIDDVRETIIENININPARDRYKIFIIDEVHQLSKAAFNALLKTLEEPPPRVTFIMATTELHKVPDTILSRCQEFEFRTIPTAKIFERLKLIAVSEKVNITDDGLREIARSGEGSMRDAQSNFDQVISFSGEQIGTKDVVTALGLASSEMLVRVVQAIAENQPKEVLAVVEDLIRRGQDLRNFCRDFLSFLRDLLVSKIAGDSESLFESAALNAGEMQSYAQNFSESDLIRFFNSLSETETQLRAATQPRYILEIGLIKLLEMRRVSSIEKILERLAQLENAAANGSFSIDALAKSAAPTAENRQETASTLTPAPEKKTLTIDFPRSEAPFEIGETDFVAFAPPVQSEIPEITAPEIILPPNTHEFEPPAVNDFQPPSIDFMDSIPLKFPPISAEELEHIEDNWLDTAYEEKLRREGDNLNIIPAASEIIDRVLSDGVFTNPLTSTISTNGMAASAAAPARIPTKPIFDISNFEPKETESKIIELSDNPTDEELIRYAENHPAVKRALRIFRGKVIKVTKEK